MGFKRRPSYFYKFQPFFIWSSEEKAQCQGTVFLDLVKFLNIPNLHQISPKKKFSQNIPKIGQEVPNEVCYVIMEASTRISNLPFSFWLIRVSLSLSCNCLILTFKFCFLCGNGRPCASTSDFPCLPCEGVSPSVC